MWGYKTSGTILKASADQSLNDVLSSYQSSTGSGLLGFILSNSTTDKNGFFDPSYVSLNSSNLPLWWPITDEGPTPGWTMPSYIDIEKGKSISIGTGMLTRSGQSPPSVNMDATLASSYYELFRYNVEGGGHSSFHDFIAGHMLTMYSPNDPLFYLHHSEVDHNWSLWQDQGAFYTDPTEEGYKSGSSFVGERMQDYVWPFSASFYRPMQNKIQTFSISWPLNPFPTLSRTVTLADVLKRKNAVYYAP
jgi:hypothetical protein